MNIETVAIAGWEATTITPGNLAQRGVIGGVNGTTVPTASEPTMTSIPVSFSAARRRFERRHHQRLCKLSPRESKNLQASYARIDGNMIVDSGEIDAVSRWCREGGVLQEREFIVGEV
jgi:hypothetical protein